MSWHSKTRKKHVRVRVFTNYLGRWQLRLFVWKNCRRLCLISGTCECLLKCASEKRKHHQIQHYRPCLHGYFRILTHTRAPSKMESWPHNGLRTMANTIRRWTETKTSALDMLRWANEGTGPCKYYLVQDLLNSPKTLTYSIRLWIMESRRWTNIAIIIIIINKTCWSKINVRWSNPNLEFDH